MDFLNIGDEYLHFALVPFVGLLLDLCIPRKIVAYLVISGWVLFIPLLFGYQFSIVYLYEVLSLMLFGCIYSSFFQTLLLHKRDKIILGLTHGVLYILILGFVHVVSNFFGSTTVSKIWSSDTYRIESIVSKGFSGGALVRYSLKEYSPFLLYLKPIDSGTISDDGCTILFEEADLVFDICEFE